MTTEAPLELGIGTLHVWVAQDESEIRVAHSNRAGAARPPIGEVQDWIRWAWMGNGSIQVRGRPVFPDRPLVIAPERPFFLSPGTEATIYPRVPIWLRLELDNEDLSLLEVPTATLSDTWWGTHAEGELCYWLPTTARRSLSPDLFRPDLCACPIKLLNRSAEDLPVDKLAIRAGGLSIYRDGRDDRLWADVTTVTYNAHDDGSEIEVGGEPPPQLEAPALLSGPREAVPRGFRSKTFAAIRSISGL